MERCRLRDSDNGRVRWESAGRTLNPVCFSGQTVASSVRKASWASINSASVMSTPVVMVSCTTRSEQDRSKVLLAQSFDHAGLGRFAKLDVVWENKEGLSCAYNRKLNEYANTGAEFIVFVHDDVYIDDLKLVDKLETAHRHLGYHIIGAAGAARVQIGDPSLWHLMSAPTDHRGFVQHFLQNGQVYCTSFGPTPSEVVLIDGLFMAVHLPSVLAKGWKFNENYDFHHYDLASCLDAVKKGLRVGVYPIHMIHESPGLESAAHAQWRVSNQRFLAEYGTSGERE
jgi:hypothetical protein